MKMSLRVSVFFIRPAFALCGALALVGAVGCGDSTTSHVAVMTGYDEFLGVFFANDPMTHRPEVKSLEWTEHGSWYHLLNGADALWYYYGSAIIGTDLSPRRAKVRK